MSSRADPGFAAEDSRLYTDGAAKDDLIVTNYVFVMLDRGAAHGAKREGGISPRTYETLNFLFITHLHSSVDCGSSSKRAGQRHPGTQ